LGAHKSFACVCARRHKHFVVRRARDSTRRARPIQRGAHARFNDRHHQFSRDSGRCPSQSRRPSPHWTRTTLRVLQVVLQVVVALVALYVVALYGGARASTAGPRLIRLVRRSYPPSSIASPAHASFVHARNRHSSLSQVLARSAAHLPAAPRHASGRGTATRPRLSEGRLSLSPASSSAATVHRA
jgi:hypothetical protein